MTAAVATRGLTKRFDEVVALDGVDLTVPAGSTFGLLGPNGAGKTTLLGVLLGLLAPTEGSFTVLGEPVGDGPGSVLRRIGSAMEAPSFYPHLSGRANLAFFQGIGGGGDPGRVEELLEVVGLASAGDALVRTYSLGMRHRLGVAYALLHDPDLLLLDEPTNGLDPVGMAEVRRLIGDLADGSRTIVLASHLLVEVEQVCDRVAILAAGRIVVEGEVGALLGAGTVTVSTTDDAAAAGVLDRLDWVTGVTRTDSGLVVRAPAGRSWELSAALAVEGIHVAAMSSGERSLEDLFIEVAGGAA